MEFPQIDPIIFEIGSFALRWYSLAYITGLLLGWLFMRHLAARFHPHISREQIDDLLFWVTLGVIIGGRLGYVLFYNASYYLQHPLDILFVWQGGMSFHGGLLGVAAAMLYVSRRHKISVLEISDLVAAVVPVGLFFGRLANFINAELWGRVTNVAWGVIFPHAGDLPRHPSQLYEAFFEGMIIFLLNLILIFRFAIFKRAGFLTGIFLLCYGTARFFIEFFREPDAHLGLVLGGLSMGQILCLFMVIAGLIFMHRARTT